CHHPAHPQLATLSLHDALPISAFKRVDPATTSGPTSSRTTTSARPSVSRDRLAVMSSVPAPRRRASSSAPRTKGVTEEADTPIRSEEHTSELQSLAYLVCRLLL